MNLNVGAVLQLGYYAADNETGRQSVDGILDPLPPLCEIENYLAQSQGAARFLNADIAIDITREPRFLHGRISSQGMGTFLFLRPSKLYFREKNLTEQEKIYLASHRVRVTTLVRKFTRS
jgi:hypothetical protein